LFDKKIKTAGKTLRNLTSKMQFFNLGKIIEEFLKGENEKPWIASMGVADPIVDVNCSLTNLDWWIENG